MPTPSDWLDQIVTINPDTGVIYFGDVKIPGLIAQDGITVTADGDQCNRLTVEFIVGRVYVSDPEAERSRWYGDAYSDD